MKLSVSKMTDEPLDWRQPLDPSWLEEILAGSKYGELRPAGEQVAFARVQRMGLDVLVLADFHLQLQAECSVCLKPFDLHMPVAFHINAKPRAAEPKDLPREVELNPAELEEAFYEGDVLDLESTLREQILLALPMFPRCREDCHGLCPRCGINLNENLCACLPAEGDIRWVELKALIQK